MEMKKVFDIINNIPISKEDKFIDDKRIEVIFNAPLNELDEILEQFQF